jgi:hypothetical protein
MGARQISDVFASASPPPNATRDSYFDPAGEELLAVYLLAAAAGKALRFVPSSATRAPRGTPLRTRATKFYR